MFGKRTDAGTGTSLVPPPQANPGSGLNAPAAAPGFIPELNVGQQPAFGGNQGARSGSEVPTQHVPPPAQKSDANRKSENYYDIKGTIFNALIDAIDLTQLGQLDRDAARDEIRDIVNEIITAVFYITEI